ncbi:MAG: hypothetical protein Kow0098_02090 [Ignavibacteriaceae bacterium]
MKTLIIDFTQYSQKTLISVIEKMNDTQSEFKFEYKKSRSEDRQSFKESIEWDKGFELLKQYKSNAENDNVIGIFSLPLENYWFSVTRFEEKVSLITTSDWKFISHLNIESFLVSEITENLLEQLVYRKDYSFAHDPPIGCIHDMCSWKTDINLKILTAYICPRCVEMLKSHISSEKLDATFKLLELARNYAFNKISVADELNEQEITFPVSIYIRKLKHEPDIREKFSLLLDLFDVSVRVSTIILSSRLKEIIPDYLNVTERGNPSLGDWVSGLNEAKVQLESTQDSFFSNYYSSIKEAHSLICRTELVKLRNDTKGHAYTLPPFQLQKYFQEYYPIVTELIKVLRKFLSQKLLMVDHCTFDRGINSFKLIASEVNGDNPVFVKKEYLINKSIPKSEILNSKNEIIMFNASKIDFISLFPYLIYTICPTCGQPRNLIIDSENKYLDLLVGHRVTITDLNSIEC